MLENLVKQIGRELTPVALGAAMLLEAGCATTVKTIPPSEIPPIQPAEMPVDKQTDYSKLSWQEAIAAVKTPEQARDYLDRHLTYEPATSLRSFAAIRKDGRGSCFDYSLVAAALLSDNGYKPSVLMMGLSNTAPIHAAFLYRTPEGYSALGNLSCCRNNYSTVSDLVKAFAKYSGINFDRYYILDLEQTFPKGEWLTGGDLPELLVADSEWFKVR
ncbi:MAG: hypothetical protein AB1668_01580 [Nanoarchaeota archaeon]